MTSNNPFFCEKCGRGNMINKDHNTVFCDSCGNERKLSELQFVEGDREMAEKVIDILKESKLSLLAHTDRGPVVMTIISRIDALLTELK